MTSAAPESHRPLRTKVLGVVSSMAPDRGCAVDFTSTLMDDLGYDSARLLELITVIETQFGCVLDGAGTTDPACTVADVVSSVEAATQAA